LYRTRFLLCCLLVILAAGCRAQTPRSSNEINRRIEVQVRSQFNVPQDYTVSVGARTKSDFPGYDTVSITFAPSASPERKQAMEFLLSKDGNTLAKLSKYDLSKDPSDMVPANGRPVRGNPDAKVTIVNFDDLECPYCSKMHSVLFPDTVDRYKGLVKIVYRDFPLVEIHPWAMHAAVDANCIAALDANAYWHYVDYVHVHGQDVSGPDRDAAKAAVTLDKLARDQGTKDHLDGAKLDACLTRQDDTTVRASMKDADSLNVDGTPTLFVNGERLSGAIPEASLWKVIDRALAAAGVPPPASPVAKAGQAAPGQDHDASPAKNN
jgi:protein-disulfide isomerase